MRITLSPARGRAGLLYAGVAVFVLLAALTARTLWRAWNERAGQARTAAVFALVQQRMPSRPIEAPGAIAWLREQLTTYRAHLQPGDASTFERLSDETENVPSELAAATKVMRSVVITPEDERPLPPAISPSNGGPSRRGVSLFAMQDTTFVVTRRHVLEADASSNGFVSHLLRPMAGARGPLDDALRGVARPVRLYALAEDGTLVSLPWAAGNEATSAVAQSEAVQLSSRPTLPSFAPEEFFFRFSEGEQDQVRYSGFYVDLGGRGLVSTLTMPIERGGQAGVLALDVTHNVDWDQFAATIAEPLAATIVHVADDRAATWGTLSQGLSSSAPGALRGALADVVRQESPRPAEVAPISHAVVRDVGAIAAFHVSERAWLLAFFPSVAPSFPGGALALLGAVLIVLLAGFEVNRRKAEREADRAARALGEKQNLLNTMQVPLVVVDPNTDEIVSANLMAESIGIRRGARFSERISPDPRARAHYERTQIVTGEARRAYGVPIRVDTPGGEASEQFAIVRSVAVTAPIEALAADERHRLAILFLIDPQSDLRLLLEDVESAAHTDERRRLSGLLSHGLDSLADVLRRSAAGGQTGVRPGSDQGQAGVGPGSDLNRSWTGVGSDSNRSWTGVGSDSNRSRVRPGSDCTPTSTGAASEEDQTKQPTDSGAISQEVSRDGDQLDGSQGSGYGLTPLRSMSDPTPVQLRFKSDPSLTPPRSGPDPSLTPPRSGPDPGLTPWLAEYLQRRIHVTAWLLDNWDAAPPAHDSVIDAAQAHETLRSLERIFADVRHDTELRARLGWANGPLADRHDGPPFTATVDWPTEFETTLPVRGGLGFFLTEVLSNAMRHGLAGSPPIVSVQCDRVRKELLFTVENRRRDDYSRPATKYGGLALLSGMSRLFGWRDFTAAPDDVRFVVRWRTPLTRRDQPGKPD